MCGCDMSKSKVGKIGAKSEGLNMESIEKGAKMAGSAMLGYTVASKIMKDYGKTTTNGVVKDNTGLVGGLLFVVGIAGPAMLGEKYANDVNVMAGGGGMAIRGFQTLVKKNSESFATDWGIGSIPDYSQGSYSNPSQSNPYMNYRTYAPPRTSSVTQRPAVAV
jgi:hypothetical protein